ncbi:hypothetical protein [Staphylococcus pseudoxylosus]|uniref:hypothetical protein n=1 Tax=Staphylococcus pseudoxylosus TaxID=2282419 RepID=UPI00298ED810|nr:hypothetical protein [Staphylococcus pseudoxylosus]MDW8544571.1 hypothetical protein [Staphylococcus pseudoxylosus]
MERKASKRSSKYHNCSAIRREEEIKAAYFQLNRKMLALSDQYTEKARVNKVILKRHDRDIRIRSSVQPLN